MGWSRWARGARATSSSSNERQVIRARLQSGSESLLTPSFVLALCLQFCFGLSYSTFFLLPKFLARQFHANADAIGAVAATALLASVLASPWTGAWLDSGSRRPFI